MLLASTHLFSTYISTYSFFLFVIPQRSGGICFSSAHSPEKGQPMKISELLLQDYDIEISNTRRTLERVPEGKNDWKCHEKSMHLGKLAMHCATLPLFGYYILEDDGMDMAAPKRP